MTIKIQEGTCVLKEEIHSEEMYNNVVKVFEDAGYKVSVHCSGYSGFTFAKAVGIYDNELMNLGGLNNYLSLTYEEIMNYKQTYFTEELHQFCEKHSLFYSFHVNSGFSIDVEELSYTVKTSEDWNKFKTMYVYHEELLEKL